MHFASVSNLLARSFLVFLIAYLWLSFYVREILIVFFIAFGVMLAVNFVFSRIMRRRRPPVVKEPRIFNPYDTIIKQYKRFLNRGMWKRDLQNLKRLVFQRRKVKNYIFLGVIILLMSFIVRFNIFYIIFATIMFSFALISLFAVQSTDEAIATESPGACPLARRDGLGQNDLGKKRNA